MIQCMYVYIDRNRIDFDTLFYFNLRNYFIMCKDKYVCSEWQRSNLENIFHLKKKTIRQLFGVEIYFDTS